jgi:hypothetical protein
MLLGSGTIEKKEDLEKYTKEQLIGMFWFTLENINSLAEKLYHSSDEEVLKLVEEFRAMKKSMDLCKQELKESQTNVGTAIIDFN